MRTLALGAIVLVMTGCSMTATAKREARLRQELDAHRIEKPLPAVWPWVLRLLADQGYQLVGRDRAIVNAPSAARWKQLTAGGFETRRSELGLVLETMESSSSTRYRAEGRPSDGTSCRVTFTSIRRTGGSPSEERSRDLGLELELVRRLDPDAGRRIEESVATAAK